MTYLTEPEAWREIARRVEKDGLKATGLCYEVMGLWCCYKIGDETLDAMSLRIYEHMEAQRDAGEGLSDTDYAFPSGEADVRVLAALFLALEAEDES